MAASAGRRPVNLLAVDPGPAESGWVTLDDLGVITAAGISPNDEVLTRIDQWDGRLAVEMIASYGMPVGREVFETCLWIGRYLQAHYAATGRATQLVYRADVKLLLCGNTRAKDPNVRRALLDLVGPQGTKKNPGPTNGIAGDMWAALGVAITARKAFG